ncbi:THUMP domain-containing class I SAM-dependent RNA methyltransferase [Catonella massiliensis]|uniref:Class I SAM-dependent RNA methyltransferase n=1 Tax=Catonella massiliensis TaxID=2799636 RepID=A0ABS1IYZ6_9FIRM|nr:class I SAM-dependent RNA methyltransferase [Catonella massiliensis]MBK5897110.1 class I SAM-dependent RNA methyltransferase [Catonella massiliensis]
MTNKYELFAPCHFGLEAVLKREIIDLGYEVTEVVDGRVSFEGDEEAIARCNVFLRTTERVMLKVGSFKAVTFDELFEKTKALPWENFIPKDGKFWVKKASSIKSKLFSPSDIQRIVKKAIVDRLSGKYNILRFPEDGSEYPIRITILKDEVTVGLDTSGESLHKRGYRRLTVKAPITETLAAALISLTPWKKDRLLIDPFCGSGTIPIEAALIGLNIAPGMKRDFQAMAWDNILPKSLFKEAKKEAEDLIDRETKLSIQGYDLDTSALDAARGNLSLAGLEGNIHFQQRDMRDISSAKKYGFIITNPPYGERLEEKEAMPQLYREMGKAFQKLDEWSYYIITGFEDAPKYFGRKPDKNRKIYNGMMKTYFYSYQGAKPPRQRAGQ